MFRSGYKCLDQADSSDYGQNSQEVKIKRNWSIRVYKCWKIP